MDKANRNVSKNTFQIVVKAIRRRAERLGELVRKASVKS